MLLPIVFIVAHIENPTVRIALRLWWVGACVDFGYGTIRALGCGCNEAADWSKFWLESEMSLGAFAGLTWFLWILMVNGHMFWVRWAYWGRVPPRDKRFWDYQAWMGILIFIGVIAVSTPILVRDEARIKTDNAAFWIPYTIQLLSLGCYISLLITSFYKNKKKPHSTAS